MNDCFLSTLKTSYVKKRRLIKDRLGEFRDIFENGDDRNLFEELAFCIFAAGASAKMAARSVEAVKDVLMTADSRILSGRLQGVHRFSNSRAAYVFHTRECLRADYGFRLRDLIVDLRDSETRRDFFVEYAGIKGIGYKESSHFLRNLGFRGYAILDKHILKSLHELGIIDNPRPPKTRSTYVSIENDFKRFAEYIKIDFDELDLLIWSERTGEILK